MGKNPALSKGPRFPVERVPFADIQEFCRILSQKNGVTVRLPTDAEWEYAARVGTSNPCFHREVPGPDQRDRQPAQHDAGPEQEAQCLGSVRHALRRLARHGRLQVRQRPSEAGGPERPAANDKHVHRRRHGPPAQDPRRPALRPHAPQHARRRRPRTARSGKADLRSSGSSSRPRRPARPVAESAHQNQVPSGLYGQRQKPFAVPRASPYDDAGSGRPLGLGDPRLIPAVHIPGMRNHVTTFLDGIVAFARAGGLCLGGARG